MMCNGNTDSEVWDASDYYSTKEEAIKAGTKALNAFLANPEEDYDQYDVLGCEYDLDMEGTPQPFAVTNLLSNILC